MARKKKKKTKAQKKISTVMREFKAGELPIGKSKKKVRKRKQAIAIALSEAREAGAKIPFPPKKSKKKKTSKKKTSKKKIVKKKTKRKKKK